jgi:2-iminobutanoate/2-iminopropanoate deaminase
MQVTFDNPATIPAPVGTYSHVARVEIGDAVFLYLSGQVAQDHEGNVVGVGDMVAQATVVYENIKALLEAHGASTANVIKMTTFVTDMSQLASIRSLRTTYFSAPYPASTLVSVSQLAHPDWLLEIEVVAVIQNK